MSVRQIEFQQPSERRGGGGRVRRERPPREDFASSRPREALSLFDFLPAHAQPPTGEAEEQEEEEEEEEEEEAEAEAAPYGRGPRRGAYGDRDAAYGDHGHWRGRGHPRGRDQYAPRGRFQDERGDRGRFRDDRGGGGGGGRHRGHHRGRGSHRGGGGSFFYGDDLHRNPVERQPVDVLVDDFAAWPGLGGAEAADAAPPQPQPQPPLPQPAPAASRTAAGRHQWAVDDYCLARWEANKVTTSFSPYRCPLSDDRRAPVSSARSASFCAATTHMNETVSMPKSPDTRLLSMTISHDIERGKKKHTHTHSPVPTCSAPNRDGNARLWRSSKVAMK